MWHNHMNEMIEWHGFCFRARSRKSRSRDLPLIGSFAMTAPERPLDTGGGSS